MTAKRARLSVPHVFPERSGMHSAVHDDVEADMIVLLSEACVEEEQEIARWTLSGILVMALCITTYSIGAR